MKVLIIFDLVPEEQKRAIIDMSDEEYMFFKKAHGVYVNNADDAEGERVALVINHAFTTNKKYIEECETDIERRYFGKWTSDLNATDLSQVDKLICSGFVL